MQGRGVPTLTITTTLTRTRFAFTYAFAYAYAPLPSSPLTAIPPAIQLPPAWSSWPRCRPAGSPARQQVAICTLRVRNENLFRTLLLLSVTCEMIQAASLARM